jgi:hypothetical protein
MKEIKNKNFKEKRRRKKKGTNERQKENTFRASFFYYYFFKLRYNPRTAVVCTVCILEQDLWLKQNK